MEDMREGRKEVAEVWTHTRKHSPATLRFTCESLDRFLRNVTTTICSSCSFTNEPRIPKISCGWGTATL